MAQNYEDADQSTVDLFERVKKAFPDLVDAKIKMVFRDKKKGNDEKIIFAEIRKFSDLVKHITAEIPDYADEGIHYCIVIDKNIWEVLDEKDRWRILFHEALHAKVIFKEDGSVEYSLRDHTINSFKEIVEIESKDGGDLMWEDRLATIAIALYDDIKEKEKEAKRGKRKGKNRNN